MKKSLRLNKDLRGSILKSIMGKFDESNPEPTSELPTLIQLKGLLAEKTHDKVYSKYNFDSVPKDLLNTSYYMQVQLPTGSIEHIEYAKQVDSDGYLRSTYKVSTKESKVEYVYTKDDPLWLEYEASEELVKAFNKEVEEHQATRKLYSEEVNQVLQGVNTTGQLLEQWEEIEEFIPESIINPSKINLPSVSVKKLNEQLK